MILIRVKLKTLNCALGVCMTKFYKYSGSGNDFILLDQLETQSKIKVSDVKDWCQRREGIGADGVIVITPSKDFDYEIRIWNADGSEAEMCGNAARSSIHYMATQRKLIKDIYRFETMNGQYEGSIVDGDIVRVKMTELYDLKKLSVDDLGRKNSLYLNTGVPHTVIQVNNVEDINIKGLGSTIRNDVRFQNGTNVDFFEVLSESEQRVKLRIYERGVEDETLCCGTGVMATAVACSQFFGWTGEIKVHTRGGELTSLVDKSLENLYFQGEVKFVFTGEL
jgi:diaminopimelate epimerase